MNQLKLFGKRVRTVRKAAKITQEEAAEAAGLNSKYFGEVERGEKQPSLKAIIAFAKALKVSPATFFQFEEDTDEKTLRMRIENLIRDANLKQLQQFYKVIRAILES